MGRPKPIKDVPEDSAILGVLYILNQLDLFKKLDSKTKRGRPYVYSNITMLCCIVVMLWMRLGSVNSLYKWLAHDDFTLNRRVREACGLAVLPDRRTFDRRFAKLPFADLISGMGHQFVARKFIDVVVVAIDSTVMRAWRGYVHHQKDKKAGRVPRPGIDTEASWTRKVQGFIYGHKLHLIVSAIPKMAVPLAACTAPANRADNQFVMDMFRRLPLQFVKTILGDQGYRDGKLFLEICELIDKIRDTVGEGSLMTWVKEDTCKPAAGSNRAGQKKGGTLTVDEKQRRVMEKSDKRFATREGKKTYDLRKASVEPAQGRIKDLFGLHTLPVRGTKAVNTYVLACVFVYQVAIFYKCVRKIKDPLQVKEFLSS